MGTHIQIDDLTPRADFVVGATAQTDFAFAFPYFEAADLKVYIGGILKTLTTDYTITGTTGFDSGFPGGTVTLVTAVSNTTVSIVRSLPVSRTVDFPPSGPLQTNSLNTQLDKLVAIDQQLEKQISRSFRLQDGDASADLAELPVPALRAGKALTFDTDGNLSMTPVVGGTLVPDTASITYQPSLTGAVSRSLRSRLQSLVTPQDFGAVGNGSTNDHDALAAMSSAVSSTGAIVLFPPGTYKVGEDVTINGQCWFAPGATLVPDADVTVTLERAPEAGLYQIFDLSASGALIALPINIGDVWGEWWGCNTTRKDNQVPLQQAHDALRANTFGGTINLGRGFFYANGQFVHKSFVVIRGQGAQTTIWLPDVDTWNGDTKLIYGFDGTNDIFDARWERIAIRGGTGSYSDGTVLDIAQLIYIPAWQERCGFDYCFIGNFTQIGILFDTGVGGANSLHVRNTDIWADATKDDTTPTGIFVSVDYAQGWFNLDLQNIVFSGGKGNTGIGLSAIGRVNVTARGNLDGENITSMIRLQGQAQLHGPGITGGPNTTNVIQVVADDDGNIPVIDAFVSQGNASVYLLDSTDSITTYAAEPPDRHLVWPLDPTRPIAAAKVTGASTPAFVFQRNFSTDLERTGTGVYQLKMSTNVPPSSSRYYVQVTNYDASIASWSVSNSTADTFTVTFRNSSGTATTCSDCAVTVYAA